MALATVLSALVIATLPDYGVTWDEALYVEEGAGYAEWLQSPSFATLDRTWRSTHPPLHRIIGGLTRAAFADGLGWFDDLSAFRLATVGFVFVLALVLFTFASELFGEAVALLVAVMFFGMPRVFFHAHIGALDLAVASLGFAACVAYHRSFERRRAIWAAAVLLGLGVATKLNTAIVVIPMLVLLSIRVAARVRRGESAAGLLVGQAPMAIVPPLIFVASWPWLWPAPIARTIAALGYHAHHFAIPTYFFGRVYAESPASYPFVMTASTVPLPTLAFALLGVFALRRPDFRDVGYFALAAALAPLGVLSMPGVPKSGGVRHFIVGYPFLCILAGAGVALIRDRLRRPAIRRVGYAVALAVLVASSVPAIVRLHPYQIAYFNPIVGGTEGALEAGFDLDYWGSSYAGLLDWINANPERVYWMPLAPRLGEFYRDAGRLDASIRFATPGRSDTLVWLNRPSLFERAQWYCFEQPNPLARSGPPGIDLARVCDLRRGVERR